MKLKDYPKQIQEKDGIEDSSSSYLGYFKAGV